MHQNMPTQKPIWNTICISTQIQIMLAHLIPICPKLKLISQKLKKEKKKGYFLNLREREREREELTSVVFVSVSTAMTLLHVAKKLLRAILCTHFTSITTQRRDRKSESCPFHLKLESTHLMVRIYLK